MNLENTKVYTTDPEVIPKYAALCGKVATTYHNQTVGVYNGDVVLSNFGDNSVIDRSSRRTITPEQINALYDEKFGNHSEAPNSSEWKNGDECTYDGSEYIFVGMTPTFNDVSCIIFDHKNGIEHVSVNKLRKPETPEQREERERLEAIKQIQVDMDFSGSDYAAAKRLYDAGYRKQKDSE